MSVSSFGSTGGSVSYAFSVGGDVETTLNVPAGAYEYLSDVDNGSVYIGDRAASSLHTITNGTKLSYYKSIPATTFPAFYSTDYVLANFNPGSISAGAYGNGMYVVGGSNQGGTPNAYYSTSMYGPYTSVTPISVGTTVRAIIYANNQFVLAGSGGYLSRSADGAVWTTAIQLFGGQEIYTLAYGNGLYVAGAGFGNLATSPDGITWTTRASQFGTDIVYSVYFANNLFVAVGGTGKISTSVDGITWTARSQTFTTSAIRGVVFGGSLFVAVGDSGKIGTSPDGVTWTNRTSGSVQALYSIDYGNGKFITVGSALARLTSTDGVTWTSSSKLIGLNGTLNVIRYLGIGVMAGSNFATDPPSFSTTGFVGINNGASVEKIIYANGLYVLVGFGGVVLTSTDAITWATRTSGTTSDLKSVIYAGGFFVAAGVGGTIIKSVDGTTWTSVTSPMGGSDVYAMTYGEGLYVIAGASGKMFTSPDLATWTSRTPRFYSASIRGLTFGDGTFVAVGTSGIISVSPDAISWSIASTSPTTTLWDVAYAVGNYIAVGDNGVIRVSRDNGASWATANSQFSTEAIYGISFIAGIFYAVGGATAAKITSAIPSGTTGTWVVRNFSPAFTTPLKSITGAGSSMVAISQLVAGIATKDTLSPSTKTIVLKQIATNITAL